MGDFLGYQSNIPQPDDSFSKSQEDLLNNFQTLNIGFNKNHEDLNKPNDNGKHKFLNMPSQESAPTTTATEGALFTKDVSGNPCLFFKEKSNGSELQITNAFTANSTGNIVIPGGIRLSWGNATVVLTQSGTISPTGIATILNIQFSINGNVAGLFAWSLVSPNSFKIIRNGGGVDTNIHWMVVGV